MKERLVDSDLKTLLKTLDFDIKAESFFAHFFKENIYYKFQNFFDRNYSRDIVDIKAPLDNTSDIHYAYLSRLGLYDIFPEFFFHKQNNKYGIANIASDYKKRKKEEKLARKFFEPIENELFNFFLDIEKHEKDVISSFGDREFLYMLNKIWDIDETLPYREITKVVKFLPFSYKISGNIDAIKYMLEHIFDIKLEIIEERVVLDINASNEDDESFLLGNTFALKAPKETYLKKYIFILTDVKDLENIQDYFSGGKMNKVLSLFLNNTIPYENEFEIRFSIIPEERKFILDKRPHTGRVGISTTLA